MSESNGNSVDPSVVARLASQRGHYKTQARETAKERDTLKEQLKALATELEAAKKGDQSGRVKELEGELRTLRHRRAFDRLAKERGAADDVLDDLFDLLKYKADKDDPDEDAIAKMLDDAAKHRARSRFFAEWDGDDDEGDEEEERTPPRREAPVDGGRGGRHRPEGSVAITREQLADPKFMLDPRNAARIKNAKIKG